jgi:hypothetical protein
MHTCKRLFESVQCEFLLCHEVVARCIFRPGQWRWKHYNLPHLHEDLTVSYEYRKNKIEKNNERIKIK